MAEIVPEVGQALGPWGPSCRRPASSPSDCSGLWEGVMCLLVARPPALLSPLVLPSAHTLADNTSFSWFSFAPTQGLLHFFTLPGYLEDHDLWGTRHGGPRTQSFLPPPTLSSIRHPAPPPWLLGGQARGSVRSRAHPAVFPTLAWALLPAAAPQDRLSTPPRGDVPGTPPAGPPCPCAQPSGPLCPTPLGPQPPLRCPPRLGPLGGCRSVVRL